MSFLNYNFWINSPPSLNPSTPLTIALVKTKEALVCLIHFLGYIKNYLRISDSMIFAAFNSIIFRLLSRPRKTLYLRKTSKHQEKYPWSNCIYKLMQYTLLKLFTAVFVNQYLVFNNISVFGPHYTKKFFRFFYQ